MAHRIEAAKSGRSRCRKCRNAIEKGALRLGVDVASDFGESTSWYHLDCGAAAKSVELEQALASTSEEIPDREALEAKIASGKKTAKPTTFPYAERATTGRSTCIACNEKIPKGELRVAIEGDIDTGSFVTRGARYLHARCARLHLPASTDHVALLQPNSISLEESDVEQLKNEL